MVVAAVATHPHYWHHIEPIWQALPEHLRGVVWDVNGAGWGERLSERGVKARWQRRRVALVASLMDAQRTPGALVYVEHGAGQSYDGDARSKRHASYPGGLEPSLERVRLFVCPNEQVAARWADAYPDAATVVAGSPRLDALALLRLGPVACEGAAAGAALSPVGQAGRQAPTVALSFHADLRLIPETTSALPHYREHLPAIVADLDRCGWRVLGHGHPRAWADLHSMWRRLGIEPVPDFADVVRRADVYVVDNSSTAYEAAALGIPVVMLNAPWYRRDVWHGLRFWNLLPGPMVDDPDHVVPGVVMALADPPEWQRLRTEATAAVYPLRDGRAAQRAADAICDLIGG